MENRNYTTASENIITIEDFNIPELSRTRRIWIYLPINYFETDKHYPTIYMHDGQNLFDETTAMDEEWCIDEGLNSMGAECIIVGIDNSEKRMNEYNFFDHEEYGEGEGNKYIQFIAVNLKPYIDEHFRTKGEREFTFLAGSSMGGLISLFGSTTYADTFGGAGVFSPALWLVADKLEELHTIATHTSHLPQKLYFYGGMNEGENMIEHIDTVNQILKNYNHYETYIEVDPEGEHAEKYWRNKFPDFYKWLTQNIN